MKGILKQVPFSTTFRYTQLAQKLGQQGKDIVRLTAGEPDFDTPGEIIDAGISALKNGFTRYTPSSGFPSLREGIRDFLAKVYGLHYSSSEIVVSNGGKHALFNALYVLTDPGDEVLLVTPDWVSYEPQVRICGCRPGLVPTTFACAFKPTREDLERALSPHSKVLVVNSPNNPTGAVYSRELLEEIAAFARQHDLWVISDEVYASLVYSGEHVSIASLPGMRERTVVVNAFSKSHAMTGWRCGYSASPEALAVEMGKLQSHMTSNVNAATQKAAERALEVDPFSMVPLFRKRRDLVCDRLQRAGIPFVFPDGAFYVFMDFRAFLGPETSDAELVERFIREYGLALVPGSAFHAPGFVRLSYAASEDELLRACDRLDAFVHGNPPVGKKE
ncbi:MAG TPA: pyridoxal phosphate-dependent aminotransferase [Thermotogota bacterium]|nr:pyridoxal phosphate-dependent aminotransferase [Thermotogota bacterium]HRW91852.1 pyridoxal phosphate-dependent aminotransferase [Thermotogota bacterium]